MSPEEFDVPIGGPARDAVADLITRTATGDQAAFARLYDVVAPHAYGVILGDDLDPAISDDILQQTFLEVWRTAGEFEPGEASGEDWIVGITVRRLGDDHEDIETEAVHAAPPLGLRSRLLSQIAATTEQPVVAEAAAELPTMQNALLRPSTETIQTIERRLWTRALMIAVGSAVLLVGLGWLVGAISPA